MTKKIVSIIIGGLIVRIVILMISEHITFDMRMFELDANIISRGGNVYAENPYYNYSPLWAYLMAFCLRLSHLAGFPFQSIVKLFLVFTDLGNAFLIYLISGRRVLSFAAYWLNPIPILIISYHGMFDSLAILPLLAAVYLYIKKPNNTLPIWLLGTLSILVKQITLFFVLVVFLYSARYFKRFLLSSLSSCAIFILSLIPFRTNSILENVFLHTGGQGIYGLSIFIQSRILLISFIIVISSALIFGKYVLKLDVLATMRLTIILFFILTPGLYGHYFLFLLLWESLRPGRWFIPLSAVILSYLLNYYFNIGNAIAGIILWLSLIVFITRSLIIYMKNRKNDPEARLLTSVL